MTHEEFLLNIKTWFKTFVIRRKYNKEKRKFFKEENRREALLFYVAFQQGLLGGNSVEFYNTKGTVRIQRHLTSPSRHKRHPQDVKENQKAQENINLTHYITTSWWRI